MTRLSLLCAAAYRVALVFALAVPLAALADPSVELRAEPVSHGATVTLADLFDGADGASGSTVVAHAAAAEGLQAVLDADRVQAIARRAGLVWDNTRGLRRIIVTSAGAEAAAPATRHARATGRRRAHPSLVYARSLMAGEIVSASDLVYSADAVAADDTPGDPDIAIGKAARRPLREGAAVETRDLANPIAVRRNDTVSVAYDADGVTLTLEAKAMNDGAVGDALQVVNPQSKKVIEAVVSGPGRAVVGPEAETLRAEAEPAALRTAANY